MEDTKTLRRRRGMPKKNCIKDIKGMVPIIWGHKGM